ncbi:MAG: hypothetical protein HFF23_07500 [Oscillospiraceae bacterium]|jgi:hypothetical protein|nr:hypothetical protein [Oscillospiraceae bacterium]
MNEKEPLGVPAGGGGSDGHGPGAPASPPSGPAGEGAPGKQAEGRPDGNPGPEQTLDRHVSRETSPHPPNGKRSSFYVYLAVLFGAAFLMLLLAYFVQRRNNETAISALRSTMDLSREELMEEIQGLEEEKLGLEGQITQLEEQLKQEQESSQEFQTLYDGARSSASHLEYCLCKRSEAIELFWQLDRAYSQGHSQRCRELIELLEAPEADPLKNYLPDTADRDSYDNSGYMADWPSPAERYREIYDKLAG